MQDTAVHDPKLPIPDLISYNSVINACAKGARWEKALSIFKALDQDEQLVPDEQLDIR